MLLDVCSTTLWILCHDKKTEDENHVLLECSLYDGERTGLLNQLDFVCIDLNSEQQSFLFLMSYGNDSEICKALCNYVDDCFNKRNYILNLLTGPSNSDLDFIIEFQRLSCIVC